MDAKIFCVEVSDDAVALEGIGSETFEEEFATMDGYVLIPVTGSRPIGFQKTAFGCKTALL